jgi:outer membrane receptor for ferrienterochelin and colicins
MYLPHTALSLLLALPAAASVAQTTDGGTLRLSPLVVSASGFEQDIQDAPASISVITREELEDKRVSSLADALRDVEGIDVMSSAGKTGGHDIRMRGMPSEYTLILIDGRRQNAAGNVTPNGFGETQTSFMPPVEAIERIEVIRGPMSTLYGSDAMGGVINIITRKVPQQWGGSVTVEGTFNQDSDFGDSRALELYTSGPVVQDLVGLQLRGRIFERDASDLTYRDASGNPIEVSQRGPSPVEADIYSLGGRLTFTPGKEHDLWLDAELSRQKYNNDEGQLGSLDDPNGRIQGYADTLRFEREQVAIGHTGRFSSGTLESSLMHNTTETIGRTIPGGTAGGDYGNPFPGFPNMIIGSPRELKSTNLVLDSKFVAPIGDHVLSVGGQWLDAEMTDGLATGKFTQTTWALFAEDEWYLRDDLSLTVGGRYDHHDSFGGQISPRAYLVWNTTERWTLKGGVSRGYRTPSLNDLHEGINGVTGQGTIITIGSPDLKPEISTTSEFAVQYSLPNGFMTSATLFNNDFDDKIATGPDIVITGHPTIPDGTYSQKINVDKAVTRGLELATRIPLAPAWVLSANYTYTDSEQKSGADKGNPLTDTPKHMVNANLRWQTIDRLSAWLRGEYNSERYRSRTAVRGAPSYADLGDFKAYALFHLGGSYQATTNLTLHATVYNLLDKDFVDYRAYDVSGTPTYGNVYANSEPGRRLWLSANLRF